MLSQVFFLTKVQSIDTSNRLTFMDTARIGMPIEINFIRTLDGTMIIDSNIPKFHCTINIVMPMFDTPDTFSIDNLAPFLHMTVTITKTNKSIIYSFQCHRHTGTTKTWTVTVDLSTRNTTVSAPIESGTAAVVVDDVPKQYSAPPTLPRSADLSIMADIDLPIWAVQSFATGDYSELDALDFVDTSSAALAATQRILGLMGNVDPISYTSLCVIHDIVEKGRQALSSDTTSDFWTKLSEIQALKSQWSNGESDPTLSTFPPLSNSVLPPVVPTIPVINTPVRTRTSTDWIPMPNLVNDTESATDESFDFTFQTHASMSGINIFKEYYTRPLPWCVSYLIEHDNGDTEVVEPNKVLELKVLSGSKSALSHVIRSSRTDLTTKISGGQSKVWILVDDYSSILENIDYYPTERELQGMFQETARIVRRASSGRTSMVKPSRPPIIKPKPRGSFLSLSFGGSGGLRNLTYNTSLYHSLTDITKVKRFKVRLTNSSNSRLLEFFCTNGPNTKRYVNIEVTPMVDGSYDWDLAVHPTITPAINAFMQQVHQQTIADFGYEIMSR